MVALSFQPRFVEPYKAGRKGGTIRRPRADGKIITRPGSPLTLYTALRTKHAKQFGTETCLDHRPITLLFDHPSILVMHGGRCIAYRRARDLDAFAVFDGFEHFADMRGFWMQTHPDASTFKGYWTLWREFVL